MSKSLSHSTKFIVSWPTMLALILSTLLISISTPTLAADSLTYHSDVGHFGIILPSGWERIPDDIIGQYYAEQFEGLDVSKETLVMAKYAVGFQEIADSWLQSPYIVVSFNNTKMSEIGFKASLESNIKRGFSKAESLLESSGSDVDIGDYENTYDEQRRVAYITTDATGGDGTKVKMLTAMHLGRNGFAAVYSYALANAFDKYMPIFTQVNQSLVFDSGYQYESSFWNSPRGSVVGNVLKYALVGAVIGVVWGVLKGLFNRRKRKDQSL